MGSSNRVHCSCGFTRTIQVGGTRFGFRKFSSFPHFCTSCGFVEVNVAQTPTTCPTCHGPEVTAYGTKSLAKYPTNEIASIQHFSYATQRFGNLCPYCNEFNLVFEHADILFD